MLKGKMITGSEAIIRRLEISEASFMFLIQMKKLPARLNQDCRWEISEADLRAFEVSRAEQAAKLDKKKDHRKN